MVMQAHIKGHITHTCRSLEYFPSLQRMAFNQNEFFIGEAAGFIEYLIRDHHFADVMQQACHPQIFHQRLIQPHLFAQRDHQCAYGNRMQVGVVILGF